MAFNLLLSNLTSSAKAKKPLCQWNSHGYFFQLATKSCKLEPRPRCQVSHNRCPKSVVCINKKLSETWIRKNWTIRKRRLSVKLVFYWSYRGRLLLPSADVVFLHHSEREVRTKGETNWNLIPKKIFVPHTMTVKSNFFRYMRSVVWTPNLSLSLYEFGCMCLCESILQLGSRFGTSLNLLLNV